MASSLAVDVSTVSLASVTESHDVPRAQASDDRGTTGVIGRTPEFASGTLMGRPVTTARMGNEPWPGKPSRQVGTSGTRRPGHWVGLDPFGANSSSVVRLASNETRPGRSAASGRLVGAAREPGAQPDDPPPIFVNVTGGVDNVTCGGPASPCATFRYAVNSVANQRLPLAAVATVVLGPGVFGPESCSANATRPVNITGAGSGVTTMDCGGVSRALSAYSSVSMSGITVTRGFVDVSGACGTDAVDAGGGGGVAVVWAVGQVGSSAMFLDVVFLNNTVVGTIPAIWTSSCGTLGGGGLFLGGGGNDTTVALSQCSFIGNAVSVAFESGSDSYVATFGGGACVVVGDASGADEGSSLARVIVDVSDCLAQGNTMTDGGNGE